MTAENTANDYAVAKVLSGYVKNIFSIITSYQLIGPEEGFSSTGLNRAYVLLVNQLEILYERNPKLANINPEPTWKRFEVIKNYMYAVQKYLEKNGDFGMHIDKIDKLCIISGEKEPEFSTEQQEIIDTAKSVIEAHNNLIVTTAQRLIDGIVCWKLDRLSRNPTDSGRLQQLLQDGKLKHILTNDKSYRPEDNAIVFSVEAGMSNQYIRELASNTKRGMQSKAEKGDKPGIPPIGYLNDRLEKVVIIDSERFNQVRILWDKMLTGTYSIAQLVQIADKELHITTPIRGKLGGKPIACSTLCNMFRNPFYTGQLRYKDNLYPGNHTPMITEEEFEKVQQIIDPSHTTRPKDKTYNFPLRNLFKCGECGFAITAEQKQKHIKSTGETKAYTYYHCTGKNKAIKCSQPKLHVNEDSLMQQLKDKLSGYTIDPDFYKLAIEALAQQEDEVVEKDQAQTTARDKAIEKKKQAITNLRRMRYNGEANDDSWYFAEMQTLEDELKNLEDKRNAAEYKARDWRATADEVFTFARYAKEDFDSDDLEKKRTVVVKLGEKLTILDRTIQFTPNKYFVPIEKMNNTQRQLTNMVRTENSNGPKSKNTPVGVLAIPNESTSILDLNSSWLRRLDYQI